MKEILSLDTHFTEVFESAPPPLSYSRAGSRPLGFEFRGRGVEPFFPSPHTTRRPFAGVIRTEGKMLHPPQRNFGPRGWAGPGRALASGAPFLNGPALNIGTSRDCRASGAQRLRITSGCYH